MNLKSPGLAILVAIGATTLLCSKDNGIFPTISYTRSAPSCGTALCHTGTLGGNSLKVATIPTARSLATGQAISITTNCTGGAVDPLNHGGLAVDVTRGTLRAGTGTSVNFTGRELSHTNRNSRTWTYGFTAPTTPGAVDLYVAVNAANGDGQEFNDTWAFHGYDGTSTVSTPVRLFVNATGVTALGASCVGSFGQFPVLGADQVPSVGNANFKLELRGAAPAAPVALVLGANPAWTPLDLTPISIPGCTLYVDPLLTVSAQTTAGNAQRAEGTLSMSLPIPADPALQGRAFEVQFAIVDASNGRFAPVTMTNGLSIKIQ